MFRDGEGGVAGSDESALEVVEVEFVRKAVVEVGGGHLQFPDAGVGAGFGLGGDDCGHFPGGGGDERVFVPVWIWRVRW